MTQAGFPGLSNETDGLFFDGASLVDIAQRFGSPTYVYSARLLSEAYERYAAPLGERGRVCYAVKANSNLSILKHFKRLGAGFDIVSGGELAKVLAAGGQGDDIVFSGVGKNVSEIRAAMEVGIRCFNVESEAELERINGIAQAMNRKAPVSLRINPDVDAGTHPYISTGLKTSKFGIAHHEALALYQKAKALAGLDVVGIDCHIGSQLLDDSPLLDALDRLLDLVRALAGEGIALKHLDLGGGLGIRYRDEEEPDVTAYLDRALQRIDAFCQTHALGPFEVLVEPGRSLVGNAGILLTRVEYLKDGESASFAIVDAAMNDLMRPALYEAWHEVEPVRPGALATTRSRDVVGPVCESGDWLARERTLPLAQGDLVAILSAGAYGMSMASNYNSRPRACEVMIEGSVARMIRPRETIDSLLALELTCL